MMESLFGIRHEATIGSVCTDDSTGPSIVNRGAD